MIGQVMASWSHAEASLLHLFVTLMGGKDEIAADVFLALESQSAKTSAISAAAKRRPEPEQELLRAILAIAKGNQKRRDAIAHGAWGFSADLPDALLLSDTRTVARGRHGFEGTYVYTRADFESLMNSNYKLASFGRILEWIMMDHVANREGKLYAELCAEPEIQEKLNRPA
jgi:hypothetical protein